MHIQKSVINRTGFFETCSYFYTLLETGKYMAFDRLKMNYGMEHYGNMNKTFNV